jgi:hypothetical protein
MNRSLTSDECYEIESRQAKAYRTFEVDKIVETTWPHFMVDQQVYVVPTAFDLKSGFKFRVSSFGDNLKPETLLKDHLLNHADPTASA